MKKVEQVLRGLSMLYDFNKQLRTFKLVTGDGAARTVSGRRGGVDPRPQDANKRLA